MAEIHFTQTSLINLKGKVIVLTGGAQGIGAATVTLLCQAGAHVFFGDWDDKRGRALEESLAAGASNGGSAVFSKLDVRDYAMQLSLFQGAFSTHGRVDVAISCAAIKEPPGLFEPEDLNLKTVQQEPTPVKDHIDVNLTSVIAFSRIALAYMKETKQNVHLGTRPDPLGSQSIVLVSSIAGITEAPGLFSYSPAKHGIIGLMRAFRPWAPLKYGVRVNAICPWATDTQLLSGVKERWERERMPMNSPEDVARMIIQCAADGALNGKAIFVSGGRGFDVEEGIDRTRPLWLGEENAVQFDRGQGILGLGDKWTDTETK